MNIATLVLAEAVLRTGGVQAAARALGAPPSTASTALGRLEARLSVNLLRRDTKGSVLTAHGASFVGRLAKCTELIHAMFADVPDDPARSSLKLETLFRFADVVEAGSIRRAARVLETGQPAMSRSIRQLEEAFSVTLLLRSGLGAIVTPAGATIYGHVTELRRIWWDIAGGSNNRFRRTLKAWNLACVPPADSDSPAALMTSKIAATWMRHHGSQLFVSSGIADHLLEGLELGRFDAVLSDVQGDAGRCVSVLLMERPLYLHRRKEAGASAEKSVADILRETPLAIPSNASGLRNILEGYLVAHLGASWQRSLSFIEVDSFPVITDLVRSHGFCTILPATGQARSLGLLRQRLPQEYRQQLFLISSRQRRRSTEMAARIIDLIGETPRFGAF